MIYDCISYFTKTQIVSAFQVQADSSLLNLAYRITVRIPCLLSSLFSSQRRLLWIYSDYLADCPSRTLYSRLKEHAGDLCNKAEENPLYKHQQVFHERIESKFNYTPHKFLKDPLTRQINEGTRINMSLATNDRLMNSRSEFRHGAVPRVQFVRGIQD